MTLVIADRVRETSTSTGTSTFVLAGAVVGYQSFFSAIGNANTTYYTISNQGTSEWEVGIGTISTGSLTRTTVLASSNAGALVNFSAGTKDVFGTYPAEKAVYLDASGNVSLSGTFSGTISGTGAFTTLSASSTVSGTGFSTYLASPPAIGGTAAASGAFTTLSASSTTTLSGGTANGVAYLNGSKVLTTGSALTFNGTTLATSYDATIHGLTVGLGGGSVSTNTAVGASALLANTSGYNSVALGQFSLIQQTSGNDNTALGKNTLYSVLTGANNTAVGSNALYSNTASNNTAVGYQAGYQTTAGGNSFFGISAGYNVTTGTANTYIGNTAGPNSGLASTGSYNTAVGQQALQSNTTASNNTAVGYQAGYSGTTSAYNVFVGWQAGYNQTTGNAGQGWNTFIGAATGFSTTGYGNTFIGTAYTTNGCGYAVTTGTKNTIIGGYTGNQGGLDIRTASNYIVLSDGDGNPVYVNSSVNSTVQGVYQKICQNARYQINTGKMCIAGTLDVTNATLATVDLYNPGNNRVGFKVTVRAISAVNNYANTMVAYAYINASTLAQNTVSAFAQDNNTATAWGGGLTTMSLSWGGTGGSTASLYFNGARSGNYCTFYVTIESWQLDGNANVVLNRPIESFG